MRVQAKMPKDPDHEQRRHEGDAPDEEGRQHRRTGGPRRPPHHVGFRRLERQRQRQADGADHVDPQDLQRRDGQREAEQDRRDDGEGLAAIDRQQKDDRLLQVVVNRPTFFDGGGDGGEIVVGQHHFGGFLGRLGAVAAHGDADIGALQRRCVVDAVAGHGDDLAAGLQGHHQAQLVLRAGAGEDIDRQRSFLQALIVEGIDIVAGEHGVVVGKTQLRGDRPGGAAVIAGDHLDANAGLPAFGHRLDGLGAGRIDQSEETEQRQPGFHIGKGQFPVRHVHRLEGDRQHPLALGRHLVDAFVPIGRIERLVTVPAALCGAHLDDPFGRTLQVNERLALVTVVERCQ